MEKIIFVIDIDAFFTSCEEIRNESLKNKPLVVGRSKDNRGIVSAANYAARKYGINSAMPIYKAIKMCKDLKIIEPDFKYYSAKSEQVFNLIKKLVDKIEPKSIDECYVDVTNKIIEYNISPFKYAKKIQKLILDKTNLSSSIGISDYNVYAKIASNINKPFGIYEIYKKDIREKLWNLSIKAIPGCGTKTSETLNKFSLFKIVDLIGINQDLYDKLKESFGIRLDKIINISRGFNLSNEIVEEYYLPNSISLSETFSNLIKNYDILNSKLIDFCTKLVEKLKHRDSLVNLISIGIKEKNKVLTTKQKVIGLHTDNLEKIIFHSSQLFEEVLKNRELIFLSLTLGNIREKTYLDDFSQMNIDELSKENLDNLENNQKLVDDLNFYFNKKILFLGENFVNSKRHNTKRLNERDGIKFKSWGN